jgi:hypothetical protein
MKGNITTTGTGGVSSTVTVYYTTGAAFIKAPIVVLTDASSVSPNAWISNSSTSSFTLTIRAGCTAPSWNYIVIE